MHLGEMSVPGGNPPGDPWGILPRELDVGKSQVRGAKEVELGIIGPNGPLLHDQTGLFRMIKTGPAATFFGGYILKNYHHDSPCSQGGKGGGMR